MLIRSRGYYVYILTNKQRTVLYTGMTNDLKQRMQVHASPRVLPRPKRRRIDSGVKAVVNFFPLEYTAMDYGPSLTTYFNCT